MLFARMYNSLCILGISAVSGRTQPKNQLSLQEEDADRQGFAGKALLIIA